MSTASLKTCRSCNESELVAILSLGETPLANSLLTESQLTQPEPRYPLDLVLCPKCSLVQISETVPSEELFREYLYFSSFSDTMLDHAKRLTHRLIESRKLNQNSHVVEVASNDGYLLQYYKEADIPVLGIEPALNIAEVAREKRGIPTLTEFFGEELATKLRAEGKLADVIHANNVLAHASDINDFARGLFALLKDNGVAVIEVPYVKDLIDRCEFDTIYHEHLCYFSLTALDHLFSKHGLRIIDVERIQIHGGSLRVFVSLRQTGAGLDDAVVSERVQQLLDEESRWGVDSPEFYRGFGVKVELLRQELVSLLNELKSQGHSIAVYGASAKSSTLLNYFGIGGDTVEFVVDRSTIKQGRYTPGTHLPICAPEKLLEAQPNYVLLLTWNFADEILGQQQEFRERGGRFIIPIPELRIV
jgi:SAM-dependent methyltransferase